MCSAVQFVYSEPSPPSTHTQVLTLTQNAHWVFFHCWQGGQLGTMIVCSFAAHFRMLSVETVWLEEGEESSDGPVLAQDELWVAFLSGQMDRTMHPAPHCMQRLPGCFFFPPLPACLPAPKQHLKEWRELKMSEGVWLKSLFVKQPWSLVRWPLSQYGDNKRNHRPRVWRISEEARVFKETSIKAAL